jgi:hypothetical protein
LPAQFLIDEEGTIIMANYGLFKAEKLENVLGDSHS